MSVPTLTLSGGVEIPALGLGVYQSRPGHTTRDAVTAALEAGYRHIDTATVYRNEADVGQAIRESSVPRDQIFVTTKLWNSNHGYDPTLRAFDRSLDRFGFEYIDLYLVHWPVPGERLDTWRAMERVFADGRARAIGVSNYMPRHLEELLAHATVQPAVNQFELSPYLARWNLVEMCRSHDIAVETYSPLTKGHKLGDRTLADIGAKYDKSPAQILIRWALDHGFVVIPKSVRPARIRENMDVFGFSLDTNDLATLDALDEGLVTGWDPTDAP
jgi:diketogulonate reductase-like aldo/keto reductase